MTVGTSSDSRLVPVDTALPIWDRFFSVAPLVVVGTREETGAWDLAPKHMAGPLGWENRFGFVCAPTHRTYTNIRREGVFAVSYPRPDQVVLSALAASPRCEDDSKPIVSGLPVTRARNVDAPFLRNAYLCLECELERIVDDFGPNSLVVGKVVACWADSEALREGDRDDQEIIGAVPLMAYLHPGRWAVIEETHAFPFPTGYRR